MNSRIRLSDAISLALSFSITLQWQVRTTINIYFKSYMSLV